MVHDLTDRLSQKLRTILPNTFIAYSYSEPHASYILNKYRPAFICQAKNTFDNNQYYFYAVDHTDDITIAIMDKLLTQDVREHVILVFVSEDYKKVNQLHEYIDKPEYNSSLEKGIFPGTQHKASCLYIDNNLKSNTCYEFGINPTKPIITATGQFTKNN